MTKNTKSTSPQGSGAAQQARKFLTFFLGDEEYGLEILTVREIIGLLPVTPVPQSPHYIRGVVNLRGQVIPVVDIRSKFGMAAAEDTEETCITVVQTGAGQLGLVVDRVSEVLDIPEGEIVDTPTLGGEMAADFLLGIGKVQGRVVLLLNIDEVFQGAEELLSELAA